MIGNISPTLLIKLFSCSKKKKDKKAIAISFTGNLRSARMPPNRPGVHSPGP